MNITKEEISPVDVRLTVAIEENDYKDEVTKKLKEIGRTHVLPGFRKGHVPFGELKRRFGKQMTSDVINDTVYRAVIDYITENNLPVMGHPVPVEVKEAFEEGDQEFKYDLALIPQLDIKPSNEDHYPFYEIEVTEDMINEQDKNLRKRFGAQVPGEEFEPDSLVKGAIMELNEDGTVKEGDDAIQVVSGIVAPMYFVDKAEAAKFEGKKVGDKVVFNPRRAADGNITELSSMLNIDKERAAAVQGDFEMAISEIIVVRPAELGEEFYTNVFGKDQVSDENTYREKVKEMIASELAGNSDMLFRFTAKKELLAKYGDMQLPDAILKAWLISRNEGLNAENIDESYDRMKDDLKWQLIKEQIAKILEIKIEEDDLLEFAKGIAYRQFAQYGMTNVDDETLTNYAKNIVEDKNYRGRLVEQVGDVKLFNALKNAITLDEKNESLDSFKEIASKMA